MENGQYRLEIRFGDDLLEAGFTAVPNLLLKHYRHLDISDSEAMWIVHLLRFKWKAEAPRPRQPNLPMSCSEKTRRRYARHLRKIGLLFTRRIYHTTENAPRPDLAGKMKTLEYHFDSLFHNIIRVSAHLATGKPLKEFIIELPFDVIRKVATGFYHDVPDEIKLICEKHIADGADGPLLLLPQNGVVDNSTPPKATTRKWGSSTTPPKATTRKWGRHKEDSCSKEESKETEKKKKEVASKKELPTSAPTPDSDSELIHKLLSDFGILGKPLKGLVDDKWLTPTIAHAWLLYLDTQDFAGKQGYLVNQLRDHQKPPIIFLTLGQLTSEQIAVLKELASDRKWTARWDQERLAEAGIKTEIADLWYEHLG